MRLVGCLGVATALTGTSAAQDVDRNYDVRPGMALIARIERTLTARGLLPKDPAKLVRLYAAWPDTTTVRVWIHTTRGTGPNKQLNGYPQNAGSWKAGAYGVRWESLAWRPDSSIEETCRIGQAVYDLKAKKITETYCLPTVWANPPA